MHHTKMNTKELTLKPKYFKTMLMALVSLALAFGGTLIIEDESIKGWLITSFFGLCFLILGAQIIPGSTHLKLNNNGFIITSLFRSHFTAWSDVKTFRIGKLGPNETVMMDYVENHNKHTRGKWLAKRLTGSHGAFPTTYGMTAEELLQTLKQWQSEQTRVHNRK
jgi:hypothetical protein